MRNHQRILETLIESIHEGIHIVDEEGRTIYYNSIMEEIEGTSIKDVLGKKVNEISDIDEASSTLMNSIKYRSRFTDVVQKYSSYYGKEVTSLNTTVPVFEGDRIIAAIEVAKDMTQLKEMRDKLTKLENKAGEKEKGYVFEDIITINKDMLFLIEKAKRASRTSASVIISGETGCGKELFAQSIHYDGDRRNKPFIAINCAAIPATLLEGTLFGTIKGSFTGAENKEGLFSEANGGTIFLDEISSMDVTLQSKLLRVLQEGTIRPVGSTKEIDVDVRVIAAINEEPQSLISSGLLRKDLYYRLAVVKLELIALKDRKEDIPLLVEHFIAKYNKTFGREIRGIQASALKELMKYSFPGNVRELRNIIEAACIMSDDKSKLSLNSLKGDFYYSDNTELPKLSEDFCLEKYLEDIEKKIIMETLKKNNNNISKSSRALKLSRQSLQYKIKRYFIWEEMHKK